MKIILIGYGKMGRAIEKIAVARGHEIAGRIDIGDAQALPAADVAIEFTQPESAVANIHRCIDAGIPVVVGTTGWQAHRTAIEQYVREKNGALFTTSNFSPGVNIFFHLNQYLARLMNTQDGYHVSMEETHHTQKKDAPSGTAITLAEGIIGNFSNIKSWSVPGAPLQDAVEITSLRIDPAPGTHVIRYQSAIDDIEIRHTAHSREGFATGAVLAAEWLPGKKGVFGMNDLLKF